MILFCILSDNGCVQDVKFWPSLPKTKLTAFRRMKMCNVAKVILKFDRAALPQLLHGCVCSESFIPEFWFRCGGMPKPGEKEPLIWYRTEKPATAQVPGFGNTGKG